MSLEIMQNEKQRDKNTENSGNSQRPRTPAGRFNLGPRIRGRKLCRDNFEGITAENF